MDDSLPDSELPRKTWADRVQAIFEVLLLSGLLSSILAGLILYALPGKAAANPLRSAPSLSLFILLESGIALLLLAAILRYHRESLRSLGLHWSRWKLHLILGLALVPFLFIINAIIAIFFKLYLPQYYIDKNPLTELIRTPQQLILLIFSALIAGGIKEELQRAFIITRFRIHLGGAGVGLVLWSIAFGFCHYIQGVQAILVATVYGFVFGIIYILSGSLIAPIVAHSAYDTLVLLAYWFLTSRYR
jgi:uncharacterized protein